MYQRKSQINFAKILSRIERSVENAKIDCSIWKLNSANFSPVYVIKKKTQIRKIFSLHAHVIACVYLDRVFFCFSVCTLFFFLYAFKAHSRALITHSPNNLTDIRARPRLVGRLSNQA